MWLLRHAKAVSDPPQGGTDHERALAPRGRRDADALGRRLAADGMGFPPSDLPVLALCSTATRTTQTAERALAGLPTAVDRRRRLYYGSARDILAELRAVDDDIRSALLVGHNPATHSLALGMLAAGDTAGRAVIERRGFPTCALAVYRLPAPSWQDAAAGTATLAGFFTPPY